MIKNRKGALSSKHLGQMVFFILVIFIGILGLVGLPRLTVPLGIAYILVLVMNPLIPHFRKIGMSRNFSIFVLFLGLGFCIIYPIARIIPTIKEESENFQFYIPKMESFLRENFHHFKNALNKRFGIEIGDKILNDVISYGQTESKNVLLKLPNVLASFIEWLFLVPLFLFFFLKDGTNFKYAFLRIVPNPIFEQTYYLFYKFNKQLGDYIFAKFIEASLIGLITTTGLLILKVRFALLLGAAAAITNVVPYVGPVLGLIPASIVAMVEYGIGPILGAIVVLYLLANIIDLAFIFPVLVSKIVDIHPIVVVVSVIWGSTYMGIIGMVISVPLAVIFKLIIVEIYKEFNPSFYKQLM